MTYGRIKFYQKDIHQDDIWQNDTHHNKDHHNYVIHYGNQQNDIHLNELQQTDICHNDIHIMTFLKMTINITAFLPNGILQNDIWQNIFEF